MSACAVLMCAPRESEFPLFVRVFYEQAPPFGDTEAVTSPELSEESVELDDIVCLDALGEVEGPPGSEEMIDGSVPPPKVSFSPDASAFCRSRGGVRMLCAPS
jgi:hypothetical protein